MVLIIVMMIATLLLVALTATLPSVYQEGQREREKETIFRGKQYAIAVALFHRKFNRYPVSVKELMGTNGMRFLRKEYSDPLDRKGKWRFIHANAAGVLIDSKNQPLNANQPNPAGLGAGGLSMGGLSQMNQPGSFGGPGQNQLSPQGGMFSQPGSFGGPGQSMISPQGGMFSQPGSFGGPGQSMISPQGGMFSQPGSFGGSGQSTVSPQVGQTGPQTSSSMFGGGSDIQGAFIVGVAPTSHHGSIIIWNKHQHYDEWEFTGIDLGVFGIQVGTSGGGMSGPMGPGQTLQPGQQPMQPGFGPPQGGMNPMSAPFGSAPPSN